MKEGHQTIFGLSNKMKELPDCYIKIFKEIIETAINNLSIDGKKKVFKLIKDGKGTIKSEDFSNQKPETFTRQFIIEPILKKFLEYGDQMISEYKVKKVSGSFRYPDLRIDGTESKILVEAEPIGTSLEAKGHGIPQAMEWIGQITVVENVSIATNGIRWVLIYRDTKKNKITKVADISIRDSFLKLYFEVENIQQRLPDTGTKVTEYEDLKKFWYLFSKVHIDSTIKNEYLDLERRRGEVTEKFYERFMDLVFGMNVTKSGPTQIKSGDYLVHEIIEPPKINNDESRREFAILLMNRLFFVKFIEERGLVKQNLLSEFMDSYKKSPNIGTFYESYLSPLFYEVFNKPINIRNNQDERLKNIPYLNGGLFRENIEREKEYNVRNDILFEIINFLESYKFKLEESSEKEQEELNPDIIGFIYEKVINILTNGGKKQQGAYYTPEEVTVHIAKNTIFPILVEKIKKMLNERYGWKIKETEHYDNLEKFLNREELFTSNNEIYQNILEIVNDIKIIDPACGSGHFLITCLHILSNIKKSVYSILGRNKEMFEIEYETTTTNLFGIDVDPVAIELSHLRLFLALISSMDTKSVGQLRKLPNIEYNIILGNSLLGITKLEELIEAPIDLDREEVIGKLEEISTLTNKYRVETDPLKADAMRDELKDRYKESNELANRVFSISMEKNANGNLVHYPIEFPDVFLRDNPGFDIVIGNPPYGNIIPADQWEYIKKYTDSKEIAGAFIDRLIPLMAEGSNLAMVITYAITFSKELSKTRHQMISNFENTKILTFDRDRCRVFSEMTQSVSFLFSNNKRKDTHGVIKTSQFLRTIPENYECDTHDISYLSLYDKGSSDPKGLMGTHRIPKIGGEMNFVILSKLMAIPTKVKAIHTKENSREIWYRTSGNYWYNAWDYKPYESSKIRPIMIKREWVDFFIILVNSSLMYFYFRVFGDGRDFNGDILDSFPIPEETEMIKHSTEISDAKTQIMESLKRNFDGNRNRFLTSRSKLEIDHCDDVLAKFYGLTDDELNFIKNYDNEIRCINNKNDDMKND